MEDLCEISKESVLFTCWRQLPVLMFGSASLGTPRSAQSAQQSPFSQGWMEDKILQEEPVGSTSAGVGVG